MQRGLDAYQSLTGLHDDATRAGQPRLAREIGAYLAYLRELIGQRTHLDDYARAIQGCPAVGGACSGGREI